MADDALPTPDRVLVVAAHPDDIEFGAGGTVARWVTEGATVRYLLVTRGDKGSDDPGVDVDALVLTRETEQRAAAAELGVEGVDFLDQPDGQVEATLALRERITFAIRSFRPEIVMTHDPTVLFVNNEWVNHPDHRAVGQVTVDAVFPTARYVSFNPGIPEPGPPWRPRGNRIVRNAVTASGRTDLALATGSSPSNCFSANVVGTMRPRWPCSIWRRGGATVAQPR